MYLGLLLCHYQLTNSWHLLQKPSSVIPCTSKTAGSVESWCLEYRSDQLSVPFRRRKEKQKTSTCSEEKQKTSTCSEEKRVVHLSLSIRISMYLSLSISQSNSISHKVFRQQWIESIKLVLTLPKIHLIPCQAGCLWGRWSNARIHQEQTYSENWSLLLRARLTQLKSLARSAFNCWTTSSNNAAWAVEASAKLLPSPTNYCHVKVKGELDYPFAKFMWITDIKLEPKPV